MSRAQHPVVIVGAGHAGVECADSLRRMGERRAIVLLDAVDSLPYQRPPLSKAYLAGEEVLPLRGDRFYIDEAVELRRGTSVLAIDACAKAVRTTDGVVQYSTLVLAMGARERALNFGGSDLAGVISLRTLEDAEYIRTALSGVREVVVIGAGFIGLEFASVARAAGVSVTVLEMADRPMARAVSAITATHFVEFHRSQGVDFRFNEGIAEVIGSPANPSRVGAVVSTRGQRYPAELVLLGVGVVPNDELARAAGLETADGVMVDDRLRSSDDSIYAIGDCARFDCHLVEDTLRIESVQNAAGQAHYVAEQICKGVAEPYRDLPWFWSIQGKTKLNIAGLRALEDRSVVRGDVSSGKFSVFNFSGDKLTSVESVNRTVDHIAARKILEGGLSLTPEEAADDRVDLKILSRKVDRRSI